MWSEEEALPGHTDWVRDVAWAPSLGLPRSTIASAGQDGQVRAARLGSSFFVCGCRWGGAGDGGVRLLLLRKYT